MIKLITDNCPSLGTIAGVGTVGLLSTTFVLSLLMFIHLNDPNFSISKGLEDLSQCLGEEWTVGIGATSLVAAVGLTILLYRSRHKPPERMPETSAPETAPQRAVSLPLLHCYVRMGDLQKVKYLVEVEKDSINQCTPTPDDNGECFTPLYYALQRKNNEIARFLIENGAELECVHRNGERLTFLQARGIPLQWIERGVGYDFRQKAFLESTCVSLRMQWLQSQSCKRHT